MKNKKIGALLSVMAVVLFAAGYAISLSPRVSQNADGWLLSVESDKKDYLPGDTGRPFRDHQVPTNG